MTNPDPAMDRLLRDALARQSASARTDACLDAETIAAWQDRTLDRAQLVAAEAHAAGCARCQAVLAAMAHTEPHVAERSWLSFPAWRWLVPVAAAAAVVVIWVALPDRRGAERSTVSAPATPPASAPAASPAPSATATAPQSMETPQTSRVDSFSAGKSDQKRPEAPKPEQADRVVGGTRFRGLTVPPEADVAAAAPRTPAAAQPVPAPPPASPTSTAAARQAAPAADRMERAFADAAEIVIPSPDVNVRWRFMPNRTEVQRTTDGGATWSPQSVESPAPLAAGASPSATVCWLVGARGTVLLTADGGASWRRAAFPEAVDLVSIRATDGRSATVTTADGRTFTTSDGGQTWVRSPAQGFPPAPF